jgi:hypothetical protein
VNKPLVRILALWTAGTGIVLGALHPHHRALSDNEAWLAGNPLRTAGCPALGAQLAAWQRSLKLDAWSIEIRCAARPFGEDILGATEPHAQNHSASIRIRDGMSRGFQQLVLVHELLHVGAADGRWPAPKGHDAEEAYVEEMAYDVFGDRVAQVRREMLARVRRGAPAARRDPERQ